MPSFHPALNVGVEEDLLPLSALLHKRGVVHRIFEENGRQVLAVQRAAQTDEVLSLYQAWRSGELRIELTRKGMVPPLVATVSWKAVPVTTLLIIGSIAGFLLYYLSANTWLGYLTFTPFQLVAGRPVFDAMDNQYWRLVTPAFIHFGWLHIVFNSLWLWELGGKVERVMGHMNMFGLFIVIALVSNASQFIYGGPGLFGGMSGVVYGLLGFSWVAPLLQPAWRIQPARPIMLFMVGWLLVCLVGLVEGLGFGAVANAAHVGGLVCGALLARCLEWCQGGHTSEGRNQNKCAVCFHCAIAGAGAHLVYHLAGVPSCVGADSRQGHGYRAGSPRSAGGDLPA